MVLIDTKVHESRRPQNHDRYLEHLIRRLLEWGGPAEHPVVMLNPAFNWCILPPWFKSAAASPEYANYSDTYDMSGRPYDECRARYDYNKSVTSLLVPYPAREGGGGFEDQASV